ncbi:MAG: AAA family ATPase, partial [Gammaproteobacteria bacterium]|nr:AAA family ATPase [Gammaproteobacteria bacterium]
MFLKKMIYLNWGNIPQREFEFGPINLFSGGNGSGKTTAADAIQTLMTAAHDTLFAFNPGQEETSQRGRGGKQTRTLASYVLGCDDGSYARPYPTDGYIAGIFHPTEGETAAPFTAVIANRAHLETSGHLRVPRLDESLYLIINHEALGLDDFQQTRLDGQHLIPLHEIYNHLVRRFGRDAVEKYDTKKQYLGRLYGALRGQTGRVTDREAMAAARAFSGFMAYKPEKKGIHHFVANEILERKDLGEAVQSVSSLMKSIHGMEEDARRLRDSIQRLKRGDDQA